MAPGWLHAGRVGRPHGLDGSFYVAEPVPGLLERGARLRMDEVEWEVVRRSGTDARPIIRLAGVESRDAAEALRGRTLRAPREAAPPLEEDEWWAEDLEGCRVSDRGVEVGTVRRLLGLPSCEVLEVVRTQGGGELLVPLVGDAVRAVDVERREIEVDLRFLGEA
jgi:16S rRNA processing protein RimM